MTSLTFTRRELLHILMLSPEYFEVFDSTGTTYTTMNLSDRLRSLNELYNLSNNNV